MTEPVPLEDLTDGELRPPRRRFQVNITLGADTIADAFAALEEIARALEDADPWGEAEHWRSNICGGPSAGYRVGIDHDPQMTPERYKDALKAWRRRDRSLARELEGREATE